ncbi:hypothetical protein CVT24_010583 [Panaeolus cyanescens]|uniref:G domain-containing protein n=1 Tax=Panaeolus cyanescens TaxID=181874 RepID=A0A409WDI4_9AGAR|nr:hypothetical protein CVT24_010583 [Panaeolus cyanescens]
MPSSEAISDEGTPRGPEISLQRIQWYEPPRYPGPSNLVFILIGPTGSGKSTFLECLASDRTMGISGNTLHGVTEEVTMYRMSCDNPQVQPSDIYFLDTPGLLDCRVPESKSLRVAEEWSKRHHLSINRILLFDRITDRRMTYSKQGMLQTFRRIAGSEETYFKISIVTTMWDQLWKEEQRTTANKRFEELIRHYKDMTQRGTQVHKFMNTPESALDIISASKDARARAQPSSWTRVPFPGFAFSRRSTARHIKDQISLDHRIGQNLLERWQALFDQLKVTDSNIAHELEMSMEEPDMTRIEKEELMRIHGTRKAELENDLRVVEMEIYILLNRTMVKTQSEIFTYTVQSGLKPPKGKPVEIEDIRNMLRTDPGLFLFLQDKS